MCRARGASAARLSATPRAGDEPRGARQSRARRRGSFRRSSAATRCSCSSNARRRRCRRLRRLTRTPRRCATSVAGSTEFRSRSSSPRRAFACCRPSRSRSGSTTRFVCSPPEVARRFRDIARCAARWTGATRCSSEREQRLLRRLAVFAGSFSLEAAEDVCTGGRSRPKTFSTASRRSSTNRSSSWKRATASRATGCSRRCKQYGIELLNGASRAARTYQHSAWRVLSRVRRADRDRTLVGGEHEPGLARAHVGPEHDNLRAAVGWALAEPTRSGRRCAAFRRRAVLVLVRPWAIGHGTGQFREARELHRFGAGACDGREPGRCAQRALLAYGLIALATGDYERRARCRWTASVATRDASSAIRRRFALCALEARRHAPHARRRRDGDGAARRSVRDLAARCRRRWCTRS